MALGYETMYVYSKGDFWTKPKSHYRENWDIIGSDKKQNTAYISFFFFFFYYKGSILDKGEAETTSWC